MSLFQSNGTVTRLALLSSLVLAGACTSLTDHPAMNSLEAVKGQSNPGQPYVEAYFEFVGPQAKWAGPPSWVVHVDAREGEWARVKTQPTLFTEGAATATIPTAPDETIKEGAHGGEKRAPAAVSKAQPPASSLTVQNARTQLAEIASMISPDRKPQSVVNLACLHPVRVRLIKQDGTVLDQQGCRSIHGWEAQVAKTTAAFLDSSRTH